MLNEREFELINIIGARIGSSQRDLSHHLDLSLGQTNMLIRRLIAKGYIRIRQLNKKKVEYLLTPKGFTQKFQKSIKYTVKTLNSIGLIKNRIRVVLKECHDRGERHFLIVGGSDLVVLVEGTFHEAPFTDCRFDRTPGSLPEGFEGVVLICTEKFDKALLNYPKTVNFIEELAKDDHFVNSTNGLGPLS